MGWLALLIALQVGNACAQNQLHWTTNYYEVSGATLEEVHRSLSESRPWKDRFQLDGYTAWQINWRFSFAPGSTDCRLQRFTTTTTITITLPRWTGPTNAPYNVRVALGRYFTALGTHEAGHARMALAAVAEVHKRVNAIGSESDCAALREKINQVARDAMTEYRRRDQEYDWQTNHGATQGAWLPLRVRNRDASPAPGERP